MPELPISEPPLPEAVFVYAFHSSWELEPQQKPLHTNHRRVVAIGAFFFAFVGLWFAMKNFLDVMPLPHPSNFTDAPYRETLAGVLAFALTCVCSFYVDKVQRRQRRLMLLVASYRLLINLLGKDETARQKTLARYEKLTRDDARWGRLQQDILEVTLMKYRERDEIDAYLGFDDWLERLLCEGFSS